MEKYRSSSMHFLSMHFLLFFSFSFKFFNAFSVHLFQHPFLHCQLLLSTSQYLSINWQLSFHFLLFVILQIVVKKLSPPFYSSLMTSLLFIFSIFCIHSTGCDFAVLVEHGVEGVLVVHGVEGVLVVHGVEGSNSETL